MYFYSILFLFLGIIFITPLAIEKNFFKYSIPLFFLIIFLITLYRPYLPEGIDNDTYINAITNFNLLGTGESIKIGLIHYLTILIPGTWQKIYAINFLSSLILFFSFKNIFNDLLKQNVSKFLIFLYLIYIFTITPLLVLIHLKQYLGFGLIGLLLFFYKRKGKKNFFYEILTSILIAFSHIIYVPFVGIYFILKYLSKEILSIWFRSLYFTKIFFLISIIVSSILLLEVDKLYKIIATIIPGYLSYGVMEINLDAEPSLFTFIYPFIFLIPILSFKIFGHKTNQESSPIFTIGLLLYLSLALPISIIEYKLPFLYGIGRIKSAIFPIVFLLLYEIRDIKLKTIYSLPTIISSYIICLSALYRTNLYITQ